MSSARITIALCSALALGGLMLGPSPASAAPVVDRGILAAIDLDAPKAETVRMICRRGVCAWVHDRPYRGGYGRPGWGGGRGYGPRPRWHGPRPGYGRPPMRGFGGRPHFR